MEMDEKKLTVETYTLSLKHTISDGTKEFQLDEPIVIKYVALLDSGNSTYMINEMMDRMKHELLSRFER